MVVPTPGAPLAVSGAPLFDASAPVYVVQGEGCTVLVDAGTGPVRLEFIAVGGALPDELAGFAVALAPAPEGGLSRTVVEAARAAGVLEPVEGDTVATAPGVRRGGDGPCWVNA
ncbi:hypothetical protein [Streptomyces sp. NRRL WC-3744]|uniref:hypothetical protein n=1 Tax=Streptomyces sp. NRRL WC-3744 TaxID=1463935 RepID=UPI0004CBBAD4|nr:hypothetical protein [Streptomyces sp. NRRL WC-3744]